jgi:uncharacterized membrane protein
LAVKTELSDAALTLLLGAIGLVAAGSLPDAPPSSARRSGQTPLEILRARYARGELEQDEYERRRQALGGLT